MDAVGVSSTATQVQCRTSPSHDPRSANKGKLSCQGRPMIALVALPHAGRFDQRLSAVKNRAATRFARLLAPSPAYLILRSTYWLSLVSGLQTCKIQSAPRAQ